jgi:integrase
MSVRKRKWTTRRGEAKEAWIVDYSQDGNRHIETFKKKKDADAYAQQVGVDIRAGTHTPVSRSITVKQAADDWVKTAELENLERSTVRQYRQHAKHIADRIGGRKLANLTATQVNAFRDDLLATMSRALARKVLTSLRSLLSEAQRRGNVAQNVALSAKRIEPDKRGERKLKIGEDIPSADEIKALIAALPSHWKPMFLTAIFAGLRASELRGLRWEDVDLKAGELHVRQRADRFGTIGPPKSEAGHRTVPVGPLVLNELREWRLSHPAHELGLVFPSPDGGIIHHNSMLSALLSAGRRAKLVGADGRPKYTGLHALRHFYASWCINPVDRGGQGLPPKVVQDRLGHASIVMTMDTYGHLFPPSDDAAKRLADAERALLG